MFYMDLQIILIDSILTIEYQNIIKKRENIYCIEKDNIQLYL